MPTSSERRIIQRRRTEKTGAILIPILEELAEDEIRPEDDEDFEFLTNLARARAKPREKGVFSPSMLGSCMRQAYFAKTGEEKHSAKNPQTNGYFLHGDFIHFKWQFALWKAHRRGMLELIGVEVRVFSASGDFAGTIDAIVRINGVYYAIDFKGINQIDWQRTVKKGAKTEYRVQIVGYAMIVNGSDQFPFHIKKCLLVSENKSGPVSGVPSPLALHETMVDVDDHKHEVRARLKRLREYVAKERIPPPACKSTRLQGFQECPFSRFCLDEVRRIQRETEKQAAKRAQGKRFKVARSGR